MTTTYSAKHKMKAINPNGWTLKQGLAAQYAAQAGLDTELGAQAGEAAWDVLKATRDAIEETDPKHKAKLAAMAIRHLKRAAIGSHRKLVEQISSLLNAVVRPESKASVNPETGLQEFYNCSNTDPECIDKNKSRPVPPWGDVWGIGNSGTNSGYEYGTLQNPVPPPPTDIEVFPVTGTRPLSPPMTAPPTIPIQPIAGPSPLPSASEIKDLSNPSSDSIQPGGELDQKEELSDPILNGILSDVSSASDAELEWAKQQLFVSAGIGATTVLAGSIGLGRSGPPLMAAAGTGMATWFVVMLNRVSHEIQNRKDAGTWMGN